MKLRQTDERYGDGGIFEAESIDAAVEEHQDLFERWVDDEENRGTFRAGFPRAAFLVNCRREYRAGLVEVIMDELEGQGRRT